MAHRSPVAEAFRSRAARRALRAALGYHTDPATKQLVIDEKPAATVRWFFREAAKGMTTNDFVKKANRKTLAARNWSSRTVLRLLTNHTYAGHRPDGAPGRHDPIVREIQLETTPWRDGRLRNGTRTRERDDSKESFTLGLMTYLTDLLSLVPACPDDGSRCTRCESERWENPLREHGLEIICGLCRGRGWMTPELLEAAKARGAAV